MTGIITFRSRFPFMPAMAIVASCPITSAATWLTASGMTGFTLPGMMLEPGCVAGSSISFRPVRAPEVRRRRSLAIFMRPTASVRSAPDVSTAASRFCIASKRSGAGTNRSPVRRASSAVTRSPKPGGAFRPVPSAVPPIGSSARWASVARTRAIPWRTTLA